MPLDDFMTLKTMLIINISNKIEISNISDFEVLIGEHDVTVAQGETRHRVARIIDHPSYGTNGIDYDYSILELDCNDKIDLTDKARAACLPSGNDASRYESAATYNVSGWGTLASGGSTPDVLNVVQVPPVTDTVCKQQYGTSQITARMMCAGKPGTGGNTIFPIP